MDKKEFLDYLVSIGWGSKVVSSARTNQPNFPNQDSAYYKKGTTFHTQHIKYTIRIPVVENDNTRVDVKINYPGKTASAPPLKDKILVFLTKIFGDPYTQNYGVTFYSPTLGTNIREKSPYKIKHWGGYINIDFLLPLMGAFGGKGEGLDMAWFLNYVKDIVSLMGISGEKSAKTINVNHSPKETLDKVKEVLNKGRSTTESSKKNKTSEVKEKIEIIETTFLINDLDSICHASTDRPGGYIYNKGDTVAKIIKVRSNISWQYIYKNVYYPARDTVY